MELDKLTKEQIRIFKNFYLINETAKSVYNAIQGGIDMNFYKCYNEYENGVFGWIKEKTSFETAIEIYEIFTSNDGWDVFNDFEIEIPFVLEMEYSEIHELYSKID